MIWFLKDEDDIIDTAKEQYRVLKTDNEFRYGYKVVVIFSVLIFCAWLYVVALEKIENCNLPVSFGWAGEWEPEVCADDK
jgi:hypothetical protein